jgi:hypothetical protein
MRVMRSEILGYSIGSCRREVIEGDFRCAQIESVNESERFGCTPEFCFLFSSVNGRIHISKTTNSGSHGGCHCNKSFCASDIPVREWSQEAGGGVCCLWLAMAGILSVESRQN